MTAPKESHEIRNYAMAMFLGLACIVLLGMGIAFRDVRATIKDQQTKVHSITSKVDEITSGVTRSAQARLIYQAQTRFLLCSRSDNLLTPAKLRERDIACKGYETLAAAYRTQGVINPPKDG